MAGPRLRALAHVIESRPDLAAALGAHMAAQLTSRMHRILYADSGVPGAQGFFGGLARRVLGRLLPPAVDTDYLRDLVAEVFDRPRDSPLAAADPARGLGRAAALSTWTAPRSRRRGASAGTSCSRRCGSPRTGSRRSARTRR